MRRLLFVAFLFCVLGLQAQKLKRVHGEYTYHAPENVTLEEAKRTALERSKLQAVADAFGTIVQQSNSTVVRNENGKSQTDFLSLGGSEVKGDWIETIGEPEYSISYQQGMLIVSVSVDGRAREIVSAKVDLDVKVLRNGTSPKFESDNFKNGDDLYLYFKSPIDGYLAVYLLDETTMQVFCLLPYRSSTEGSVRVKHDTPYIFFSANEAETGKESVDEYVMTCSRSVERNTLFIIFSENELIRASASNASDSLPHCLSYKDFQQWKTSCIKCDEKVNVVKKVITIKR